MVTVSAIIPSYASVCNWFHIVMVCSLLIPLSFVLQCTGGKNKIQSSPLHARGCRRGAQPLRISRDANQDARPHDGGGECLQLRRDHKQSDDKARQAEVHAPE